MIIAGGGTGGHLFPGLAVAEAAAAAGAEVLFVGSTSGIEARVVPKTPFAFQGLDIHAARGGGLRRLLAFASRLPAAIWRARVIIDDFRPDVVLGLGGYGSVPVVVAGWMRGVPGVVLEQNARPGMANRGLARLARCVCTAFAQSAAFFPAGKTVHTGNPVRLLAHVPAEPRGGFTVFAFGGSQGAHTVNQAMVGAVEVLREQIPGLRVLHQTGVADEEWVRMRYRQMAIEAEVVAFVEDMGRAYGRADVVVCRAGATTLAELTALGKPAILVPYPYAADDHQRANAEVLVRAGAAEMIADSDLTPRRLAEALLSLAADRQRLTTMSEAARKLSAPDATRRVVSICMQLAAKTRERRE